MAGGVIVEPYIGDTGIIILILLALLYYNWDALFHD
jgi:hypothetical protein